VAVSLVILAAVIVIVSLRPRGLGVGWPALGGAVMCITLGLVSLNDVRLVLLRTWNATLALVGLMLLSAVLDANGAFRAAADHIARASAGRGRRLFLGLCLLTVGATVLLANDGAILLMTPIVAELTTALVLPPAATLAFLFATGFLCDALSTVLPTSNLTNILLSDTLHVPAGVFIWTLFLPALATLAVSVAVLFLQFRGDLPTRFVLPTARPSAFTRRSARATWFALFVLAFGYTVAALAEFPLGVVVLLVAIVLAVHEHVGETVDGTSAVRRLPWSIVVFAAGIFIVVTAVAKAGLGDALAGLLDQSGRSRLVALLIVGGLVTALSAVGNNLPALLVSVLALAQGGTPHLVPYAALLGANVGSKLTPTGSLATLMWLNMLGARGVRIGWVRYVRHAALPTLATLLAGLLALAASPP
jgi:arsenical pump membrane protein